MYILYSAICSNEFLSRTRPLISALYFSHIRSRVRARYIFQSVEERGGGPITKIELTENSLAVTPCCVLVESKGTLPRDNCFV